VLLTGLSKGGLGGAFALLGVPILALVMPPVQAAALLLPVLLMMDAVGLWTWRGSFDRRVLRLMLPSAVAGIAVGGLAAAVTSEAMVRLFVGLVAVLFVARTLLHAGGGTAAPGDRPWLARVCGATAGFTSFVAHAGGPPFQVYVLPLRLDPKVYTGTSVIFFATVNALKVVPYAALGQFDRVTLVSALLLLPLAVAATLAGAFVVRRMRAQVFYPLMNAMILLVGAKLIWDGVAGLLSG
jgi:uncharacterized membrane protein YfcA